MKKISIIYSFRNEAAIIPDLVKRTVAVLNSVSISYEIIFVDDDSNDNSKKVILELLKNNPSIKLLCMKSRFGQMPCIVAGLKYCSGDAAIFLDSDLQDPPEVFPKLISEFDKGRDVVHTVRTKRRGESFIKMILTSLAYKIIRLTSKLDVRENAGDFKLISRNVIDDICNLKEEEPFLRTLIPWINSNSSYVEYERDPRFSGDTHFSFWGLNPIETFFIGLSSFSTFPLYLPFLFFLILSFLGILNLFAFGATLFSLYLLIMLVALFLLFSLGIVGIYLARMYRQSRNRPLYLVKEKYGF